MEIRASGVSASIGICNTSPVGLAAAVVPAGFIFFCLLFLIEPVTPEGGGAGLGDAEASLWFPSARLPIAVGATPELQQGSAVATGTADLRRHSAEGLSSVGLT